MWATGKESSQYKYYHYTMQYFLARKTLNINIIIILCNIFSDIMYSTSLHFLWISADVKAKLREQNLESSFGSQEKYVYPITAGIYAIPSSEESRSTSQAKSDDSGRGSQESYQSLLCTNMEYTSIYSIPNMQNFNTSTTSKV